MAIAYNTGIYNSNLVFALDAANPRCYPGSGTTMYDGVTTNNLTIANSPAYNTTGIKYWTFDGISNYMYNFSANNPLTSNAATVILWINPDTTQPDGAYSGMFALGTKGCALGGGAGQTILFSMGTNRNLTMAKWCDDSTNGTLAPAASTWSQVSLVKNGASTRFGVNTTFENTSDTGTQNFAGSSFTVGCTDNPGRYYAGKMAICLLYNQALTDDQIAQTYQAYRTRFGV